MGRRSGKVRAPGMGWRKFAAIAGGVMVLVTVSQMILPALTLEFIEYAPLHVGKQMGIFLELVCAVKR